MENRKSKFFLPPAEKKSTSNSHTTCRTTENWSFVDHKDIPRISPKTKYKLEKSLQWSLANSHFQSVEKYYSRPDKNLIQSKTEEKADDINRRIDKMLQSGENLKREDIKQMENSKREFIRVIIMFIVFAVSSIAAYKMYNFLSKKCKPKLAACITVCIDLLLLVVINYYIQYHIFY